MPTTQNLNLPLLTAQQSGKEAAINQAFETLDATVGAIPQALQAVETKVDAVNPHTTAAKAEVLAALANMDVDLSPVLTALANLGIEVDSNTELVLTALANMDVDLTPVLDALTEVSDKTALESTVQGIKTKVDSMEFALNTGAGAFPGEIRQFEVSNGVAPPGWERKGGIIGGAQFSDSRGVLGTYRALDSGLTQASWGAYWPVRSHNNEVLWFPDGSGAARKHDLSTNTWQELTASTVSAGNRTSGGWVLCGTAVYSFSEKYITASPFSTRAATRKYDINSDTWSSLANMPLPRRNYGACALLDGRILVAGGGSGNAAKDTATVAESRVDIYNPTTNSWSQVASLPAPVQFAIAHRFPNGKVLVLGNSTQAYLYDPATDSWETRTGSGYTSVAMGAPLSDTRVLFVFATSSTSFVAKYFDVSAPAGSEWGTYPMDFGDTYPLLTPYVGNNTGRIAELTYTPTGYAAGMLYMNSGVPAPLLLNVNAANATESIFAKKV